MKHIFLTGLVLLATHAAHADLIIEQKVESAAQNATLTMKVKGTLVRSDIGSEMTSIVDASTLSGVTLMHSNKIAVKSDGAQLKAAQQQIAAATDSTKVENTGKTEKVGAYDCTIWTMEVMGTKSTMWVAKDYPDYSSIKKEMEAMSKASGQPTPKMDVDGMVVKTVTEAAGMTSTMTLVSAKKAEVPDSEFKVPAGYQEMSLPQ